MSRGLCGNMHPVLLWHQTQRIGSVECLKFYCPWVSYEPLYSCLFSILWFECECRSLNQTLFNFKLSHCSLPVVSTSFKHIHLQNTTSVWSFVIHLSPPTISTLESHATSLFLKFWRKVPDPKVNWLFLSDAAWLAEFSSISAFAYATSASLTDKSKCK